MPTNPQQLVLEAKRLQRLMTTRRVRRKALKDIEDEIKLVRQTHPCVVRHGPGAAATSKVEGEGGMTRKQIAALLKVVGLDITNIVWTAHCPPEGKQK